MLERSNFDFNNIFKKISTFGGCAVVCIGIIVIVGYLIQSQFLKSVFSGLVSMNPLTAISFILSGIALCLFDYKLKKILFYYVGLACIFIVILFSVVKIGGIVSHLDVHIDSYIFSGQLQAESHITGQQNRMAPNTAVNFFIAGLSLLFLYVANNKKYSQIFSIAVFFLGFFTFVGYLYGVNAFTGISGYIPMAFNSAIAFIFLAISILFKFPEDGIMIILSNKNMSGILTRRLIPPAFFFPTVIGFVSLLLIKYGILTTQFSASIAIVLIILTMFPFIWWIGIVVYREEELRQMTNATIFLEKKNDEMLLSSIGDGVVAIDRAWNVTLWNKASENMTGWSAIEVLGNPVRNYLKFINESDRKENIGFIEESMLFGRVGFMSGHTVLITKDGKEVPVGDSASPIIDDKGIVSGAIIVFRNATIENEEQSLKADFAYASHQLNTPVTKALWSIEQAIEDNDCIAIKNKLNIAHQSIKSTQKLVSQLYIVSSVDQKNVIPNFEDVKLSLIFEDIINQTKEKATRAKVVIKTEGISYLAEIRTDKKLLSQIFVELVENSINYSKINGEILISVFSGEDKNIINIIVSDNGIGIPEEQQSLIFTKFFRGNNFDTTEIIGAGLGLFISREYIKILGGKIWFESQKDKTAFYISLPIK